MSKPDKTNLPVYDPDELDRILGGEVDPCETRLERMVARIITDSCMDVSKLAGVHSAQDRFDNAMHWVKTLIKEAEERGRRKERLRRDRELARMFSLPFPKE